MQPHTSLTGALAADREQALRAQARDGSSRRSTRLPRRLRSTAARN
jgi:hypothetical protein